MQRAVLHAQHVPARAQRPGRVQRAGQLRGHRQAAQVEPPVRALAIGVLKLHVPAAAYALQHLPSGHPRREVGAVAAAGQVYQPVVAAQPQPAPVGERDFPYHALKHRAPVRQYAQGHVELQAARPFGGQCDYRPRGQLARRIAPFQLQHRAGQLARLRALGVYKHLVSAHAVACGIASVRPGRRPPADTILS